MRRLSVTTPDGFALSVQTGGRPDDPTLLLLPGQANSHAWWDRVRPGFESRFRTVTFDYRGTGSSRGPVDAWSTALFAADAAHVLVQLDVPTASVYGASMGGRVAQHLAAAHPHLVDHLVLACTSPGGPHARERGPDVRRALAVADPEARRETLHRLFYTHAWPHGPGASTLLGDPTMSRDEARAHLRASADHDAWDVLPGVSAPTLVLHGTDDLMVPADNADLIAQRVPDAVLRLHQGGRHGFFEEFAETVTPQVLSFLTQQDGART